MKKKYPVLHYYLLFWLLVLGCGAYAQQDPQYTQYMYNTLVVNPGYTGSTGNLEANLLHRTQWVGIDGAPQTQAFSIHAPVFNEKIGLGLSAVNDKIGPANEVYVDANFSYSINVGLESKIAFGLKAGARVLDIDWSKGRYYQEGDPLLNTNINNKINPAIGAGIYYYTDTYYAGVSVPNFLRADYYDDIQESTVSDRLHYYVMGGYVFNLSNNLKFKPAVLGKIVSGAPITVDVSANFLLYEKLTLGASYRYDDSVSALAGFQITRGIFVGYSYDYSTTDLNKYNDGSHEFVLKFQLVPKSTRIKSPRFF
ncbi:type IX secretion system membrane protein PorP/SprF [Flavobacterium zepuense]|uniref:Type IX secretion system membrane protein PorP/SprF n=1 Tax=Flavobacterium zepuense TaxID=2593302 RepID=A0A552UZ89_9FLAO|nr:type IX secretion system membrane protein PorP/SprF [Flavobacterium zepuense]TRW23537.1 type IX secretion system membrane protein PorP/SprF [Flavobacterium zepuense]